MRVHRPSPTEGRGPGVMLGLYALLAVAFVAVALVLAQIIGTPEPRRIEIMIPAGTADRIAAGEPVDLIDENLRFALRDTLVLVNEDDELHRVGPYQVGPGETITQTFSEVATLEGSCSLHSSGEVTIEIGES